MSRKFQIKRGQSANLPTLAEGELGFTLDTGKLYVGNTNGNVEMARADKIPTKTSQLTNDSGYKTTDNNTTYTLSKSGSTITLTGSDGKTSSVTDADTNTTYSAATTSANGLMSSSDKTKLNGIATGAEVNQNAFSNVVVGSTTIAADAKTDTLTLVAGSNVTLTPDATNDKVTIAATNTTYSAATTSAAGLMSASDKSKLDGIASGANAYSLPTASSSTLGGVKTTSTVTSTSGLTACPIISGVPYYKDSNSTYSLSSFGVTATAAELNILDGVTATATELNYVDGVTSNIQTQLNAKAASSHTHKYAGSSSAGGAATSANKLNTNAGDASTPVYFSGGVPVACTSLDLNTTGNAATATKATQDGNGNNIVNTYATKQEGVPIVSATSSNGTAYTATVSGLTALTAGAMVTIVPSMTATSTTPTLNVNSLGAVQIRRKLSGGTLTRPALMYANVVYKALPVQLMYDGTYWVATQFTKPSATDLYGYVAVQNGGWYITDSTTEDNKADAREALRNIGVSAWETVESTSTSVTVTLADKTEYRYPNATSVTINAPSGVTTYECFITVGGANPTISFPSAMKCVGVDGRGLYSSISNTEISIKDGKYVIGCVGS